MVTAAIRGVALRLRAKRRWRSLPEAGTRTGKNCLCRTRRRINRNDGRAVKEGLFYVRRHTCADGAFYGHTRRRASKHFPMRAAAVAERAKLQMKLELAKEQVLKRTRDADRPPKYCTAAPR